MFGGVTAFLEKLDQQVEALAEEQDRADEAAEEEQEAMRRTQPPRTTSPGGWGAPAAAGGSLSARNTFSHRQGAAFPPLSPPLGGAPARGGFHAPAAERDVTVGVAMQRRASGGAGSAATSSTAGSTRNANPRKTDVPENASVASSSLAAHSHARETPTLTPAAASPSTRLASLFTGASSAPTVESMKLQCSSLQQSVAALEEELELAEATLAEKQGTLDHMSSRFEAAETERARWQREATYYKDIATTARDQLARSEGEVRMLRQLHEETGKELAVHRESSRRLLEEKEAEVLALKRKLQSAGAGTGTTNGNGASSQAEASATQAAKLAELERTIVQLEAKHREDEAEILHLQNAANVATRERERAQQQQQQLEQQVDTLQLDIRALKETLEGESLAHQEASTQLKQVRADLQAAQLELETAAGHGLSLYGSRPSRARHAAGEVGEEGHGNGSMDPAVADTEDGTPSHGVNSVAMAQLEDALSEAQQRCQMLSFQLLERQTALDASAREVADWRARFNALAQRVGDDEVAAAAGFGAPLSATPAGGGVGIGGLAFPKPPSAGTHARQQVYDGMNGEVAVPVSGNGVAARAGLGSAGSSGGGTGVIAELKRNPSMLHLSRRGRLGRLTVELMAQVDDAALHVTRLLRNRPIARVAAEAYVCLLQLWVVLIFLSNLAMTASDVE